MEMIYSFDFTVLNWIQQNMRCDFLDGFSVFLSNITTYGIIWIVLGIILILFKKTRVAGFMVLAAMALAFLTGDVLLKHIVSRPRPFIENPAVTLLIKPPSGSSFPSTHTALVSAVATVLLAKKHSVGLIVLLLGICVAFSRLYLYVHFPTDVFCGMLLGILCGVIVIVITKALKLYNK